MSSSQQPQEAPPSYDQAKAQPSSQPAGTSSAATAATTSGGLLSAPSVAEERRSMEDMLRPLPKGWIRQWDPESHHNFFVDTQANPPRSIWVHPFDDDQFQREHPDEVRKERERLERENLVHAETDDDDDEHQHLGAASKGKPSSSSGKPHLGAAAVGGGGVGAAAGSSSSASASTQQPKGMKKFGRTLKDKMTGTTHEQREQQRRQREAAERRAMEQHQMIRNALIRAAQTGQPQFLGRDQQGREIFAQPPPPGAFRMGPSLGYGPYQTMNGPYGGYGPYSRPMGPYARGGGMGMGGMPILGGLAGGMLLGGLLF
ncbi:uncharacterized protein PFL1_04371 [Pseudozyma flocculosa PF-1]|uniref:WW domain-containing protein n=2 Tax=Pseudozyma flocculosa TaxID=84751 RepID=A0A5C3FFE6_9BASI|nr:uncharacterized protein PFL1_04371 [Pseudozyma flocculosa PF-1]EPQ28044.1 hypothetical protein PFL1_04371 [Pseudozyma flocculosa PF-1]SPO42221.1 uncharacterized protein PSFLO_07704 [Pseudozyma flocculosa]